MNVLSLFDGISCGQVALERAGIKVDNYFASEIETNAITVTQRNYPNTIQLGDVTKWREWDLPEIDLVIGGSPCQGFSLAGKQLNFDDPRSKLFFEFADIINHTKPRYFLLENTPMKKDSIKVISDYMKVEPIKINSDLVSGQNRNRLYWTNIPFDMPKDRNIELSEVLESGFVDRKKSLCITRRYAGFQGSQSYMRRRYFGKSMGQAVFENTTPERQRELWKKDPYGEFEDTGFIRRLTPIEAERLQTLPDNYTEGIPLNARYESIGNGWTVDVISSIFKGINNVNTMMFDVISSVLKEEQKADEKQESNALPKEA